MDIRGFEVVSAFEEQDINLPTRKTTESAGYDIECRTMRYALSFPYHRESIFLSSVISA